MVGMHAKKSQDAPEHDEQTCQTEAEKPTLTSLFYQKNLMENVLHPKACPTPSRLRSCSSNGHRPKKSWPVPAPASCPALLTPRQLCPRPQWKQVLVPARAKGRVRWVRLHVHPY